MVEVRIRHQPEDSNMRLRTGSAQGVKRPFEPALTVDETERHGDALDQIARSLTAIDHNLEVLTTAVAGLAQALPTLLQKR